jgi:hypothetical protein
LELEGSVGNWSIGLWVNIYLDAGRYVKLLAVALDLVGRLSAPSVSESGRKGATASPCIP